MSGLLWPVNPTKYRVTQGFGGNYPAEAPGWLFTDARGPLKAKRVKFTGAEYRKDLHGAIDQACPVGTPIVAPETSRLVVAGTYAVTGEHYAMLEIRPGVILFFTHLKAGGLLIPVGRKVARGAKFALSGNSGMSSGPHLHHELRRGTGDPRLSGAWLKWNFARFVVGGDMAGTDWVTPP